MNVWHALIFGIVEGISEFLPISSTGHLILTAKVLQIPQTEFVKSFEIAIQLGAIFSVVALYFKSLLVDWETIKRVIVAFIPTGVIGLVFYKIVKKLFLGNSQVVLWSLLIGGIFLIVFEFFYREKNDAVSEIKSMSYRQAVLIGLFQSIAIVPGVSRSAATMIGGLVLGLKRKTIVDFSFLLAVPTMMTATALDLLKNANAFSHAQVDALLVGFVVSFVVAILSIKFLLDFITKNNFVIFGIYRILVAVVFLVSGRF